MIGIAFMALVLALIMQTVLLHRATAREDSPIQLVDLVMQPPCPSRLRTRHRRHYRTMPRLEDGARYTASPLLRAAPVELPVIARFRPTRKAFQSRRETDLSAWPNARRSLSPCSIAPPSAGFSLLTIPRVPELSGAIGSTG